MRKAFNWGHNRVALMTWEQINDCLADVEPPKKPFDHAGNVAYFVECRRRTRLGLPLDVPLDDNDQPIDTE